MIASKTPRGLRNHNPLNIRIGNDWQGERHPNTDGVFEQFVDDTWGYRAAFKLLYRYFTKYHRTTIRQIVTAWAPPSENNTLSYCSRVSSHCGISVDTVINPLDKAMMCDLVHAMAVIENGIEVPIEPITKGYEMAFNSF